MAKFLEFLTKREKHSITLIDINDVQEFIYEIDDGNHSYTTVITYKLSLQKFLNFCSLSYADVYDKKIRRFLESRDPKRNNAYRDNNKLKLLPTEFIRNLKLVLNNRLYDNSSSLKKRIIAGLILIDIYSGIRPSELLIIPYNCTSTDSIDSERIIYFFTYCKTKDIKDKYEYIQQISFKELHDTINYLKKLTKTMKNGNEWLIESSFEIRNTEITQEFQNICLSSGRELGIMDLSDDEHDKYYYRRLHVGGHVYSMPRLKQLRVYYASDLRKQGVSSLTIAKFMGHTAAPMIDYYGRDVSGPQEDYDFSADFLRTVLNEHDRLLGPRGKEYMEQINDILKSIDNSIHEKIIPSEAIEEVLKRMPIRQKSGGVCIKPAIGRPCSFDSKTDELFCAFGMCPNQIHIYYNLPYYYGVFKSLVQSCEHNAKLGFERAAEKEKNIIHYLICHYLKPEYAELEKKISECGENNIIFAHPEITNFIKNIVEIKKEISLWED